MVWVVIRLIYYITGAVCVSLRKSLYWSLELARALYPDCEIPPHPILKLTFDHRVNHGINEVLLGMVPLNYHISKKLHSEKAVLPLVLYTGLFGNQPDFLFTMQICD